MLFNIFSFLTTLYKEYMYVNLSDKIYSKIVHVKERCDITACEPQQKGLLELNAHNN